MLRCAPTYTQDLDGTARMRATGDVGDLAVRTFTAALMIGSDMLSAMPSAMLARTRVTRRPRRAETGGASRRGVGAANGGVANACLIDGLNCSSAAESKGAAPCGPLLTAYHSDTSVDEFWSGVAITSGEHGCCRSSRMYFKPAVKSTQSIGVSTSHQTVACMALR